MDVDPITESDDHETCRVLCKVCKKKISFALKTSYFNKKRNNFWSKVIMRDVEKD